MNQIKRIEELPDWEWHPHSMEEMRVNGFEFVKNTHFIWQIGEAVIAGFIYPTLLSPPWMWFALSVNVTVGDLCDFRRLATMIPPGTLTTVREGYERGTRFAKLYGFVPQEQTFQFNDYTYRLFRRD